MSMMNSIAVEGKVLADTRNWMETDGNKRLVFSVGVDRNYRKADGTVDVGTDCFPVEAYGRLAESCCRYAVDDRTVRIVGRLRQVFSEVDGKATSKIVIMAEHVEFLPMARKD